MIRYDVWHLHKNSISDWKCWPTVKALASESRLPWSRARINANLLSSISAEISREVRRTAVFSEPDSYIFTSVWYHVLRSRNYSKQGSPSLSLPMVAGSISIVVSQALRAFPDYHIFPMLSSHLAMVNTAKSETGSLSTIRSGASYKGRARYHPLNLRASGY